VRNLVAEIVIIDSGSHDQTGVIARQAGAVFEFNPWPGHIAQKNVALRRCTQPWVLSLDADEALSPELAEALRQLFATGNPRATGYFVSRRNWYLGRWIWHAWYPEWRLRLVRKDKANWHGLDPHDKLEALGETDRLKGDLLHYSFSNLREHLQSSIQHAQTMAQSYVHAGRRFHWSDLVLRPWFEFFKRLVLKQAWRDGWRGWIIAFVAMHHTFTKYAFLLEQRLNPTNESQSQATNARQTTE